MGVFGVTHGSHVVSSVTNWYPSLMSWKNRIVEQRSMPVGELVANPQNWRKHPKAQHAALAGLLSEVGVVQGVVFNRQGGATPTPALQ